METRIRENGIKAVIYILLFVFLIVRGLIVEDEPEKSEAQVKASQVTLPLRSR